MAKTPEELKAYKHANYMKNRDKVLAKHAQDRTANLEEARAKDRAWGTTYREKDPARVKKNRRKHYDGHKEEKAEYQRTHLAAHPRDPVIQSQRYKDWVAASPDKRKESLEAYRARRKGAAIVDFTEKQWRAIKELYEHLCIYCGIPQKYLTKDHLKPLIDGGNHTASNIVPSCKSCNSKKGTGSPLPFAIALRHPVVLPGEEEIPAQYELFPSAS